MKNRFKPKWRAILLQLKRYGRPDILIAGIGMLVVSVMLFQIGGLMDYWSMGELYTVEGTLQDCYIEDTRLGRHRTRILRIMVDGEEFTIWDDYLSMSMDDFRRRILARAGQTVTLQCVDSRSYERHVAGLSFRDAVYFQPKYTLEYRRQNSVELSWMAAAFALVGVGCLAASAGAMRRKGKSDSEEKT